MSGERRWALGSFGRGAFAGSVSAVVLQPLDVLKTRVQLARLSPSESPGLVRSAADMVAREGMLSLWNGMSPSLGRVCVGAGTYFCALDNLRSYAQQQQTRGTALGGDPRGSVGHAQASDLIVGAAARGLASIVTCPLTVVKTRFEGIPQHHAEATSRLHPAGSSGGHPRPPGRNLLATLRGIARHERLGGLFAGMGPTVARDAPYSGLYLFFYSMINRWAAGVMPTAGSSERGAAEHGRLGRFGQHLAAGLVAGSIATLVTHPFDVVKTRMQMGPVSPLPTSAAMGDVGSRGGSSATAGGAAMAWRAATLGDAAAGGAGVGFFGILRQIQKDDGLVRGLLRGASFRLVRRPLGTGIVWAIYEELK